MFRALLKKNLHCILKQNSWPKQLPLLQTCVSVRQYSLYEPDYLDIKPEIPFHNTLNIQLRGYDFVVLESFARYVHKTADLLDLDTEAFPVPAQLSKVQLFKPMSSHVDTEYSLALYERVVQIDNLKSTLAPVFFELLQLNMPAGIQMMIKPLDPNEEEFRYVPDLTLLELKAEVAELEKAKEERKKK